MKYILQFKKENEIFHKNYEESITRRVDHYNFLEINLSEVNLFIFFMFHISEYSVVPIIIKNDDQ